MRDKMDLAINMDCGEELGGNFINIDQIMMPMISYCNIACGFHAGTIQTMKNTVDLALENDVKIGAHPSFKDRINFGRNYIDMPLNLLIKSIIDQIETLRQIVKERKGTLHHVKAHGALYNASMKNEKEAKAIVDAVKITDPDMIIFAMHGSILSDIATIEGLAVKYESFADRNYINVNTLVPRTRPKALQDDDEKIVKQILLLNEGKIKLIDDRVVDIVSDTICLHSDHPLIFKTYEKLKALKELRN